LEPLDSLHAAIISRGDELLAALAHESRLGRLGRAKAAQAETMPERRDARRAVDRMAVEYFDAMRSYREAVESALDRRSHDTPPFGALAGDRRKNHSSMSSIRSVVKNIETAGRNFARRRRPITSV